MRRAGAARLGGIALLAVACTTASAGGERRPAALAPLASLAECAVGVDSDLDGLSDDCELEAAARFAPRLMQDPRDCEWTTQSGAGRIAGGYVHAVQRTAPARVRIAYLPAYLVDCGWDGAKCLLPGVECRPHDGDSEAIVVEAAITDAGWRPAAVFLSAHCFDGASAGCRWYRDDELRALDWDDTHPIVWVSAGRHANYPSRGACERGHHRIDTCDFEPTTVGFPVDRGRNLGSAGSPAHAGGCITADALPAADPGTIECFWTGRPFAGWQSDAAGVTPYLRYLDEIAGFLAPIDRLAWLAGCWARQTDTSRMEEQWMAPRGGMMLGMSRVLRGSETVAYEAMRIEARGDTLVFVANPSGQRETAFRATSVTADAAVFENPAHDFPQRVIYTHAPGDSLHARIEGTRDGAERGIDFRMARTGCGI